MERDEVRAYFSTKGFDSEARERQREADRRAFSDRLRRNEAELQRERDQDNVRAKERSLQQETPTTDLMFTWHGARN